MQEYILKNGLKLVYKSTDSMLSSISIALDAGAVRDTEEKFGIAPASSAIDIDDNMESVLLYTSFKPFFNIYSCIPIPLF